VLKVAVNHDLAKSQLESELKRLQDHLQQIRNSQVTEGRREGSPFGKREEEATEAAELENRLAQEKNILDQINDIDYALKKIQQGRFGLCENCSQPITPERLEALPQAKLCINCKTKLSKNGRR
jgi:RNA polymerase-binding protein DksA